MIITGGKNDGARNAAEVYDVLTGKRCTLPKLPAGFQLGAEQKDELYRKVLSI